MQWLAGMIIICFACAAAADGAPMPLQNPNSKVQIINGKKFISLQGVRRFTGGTNSPKALSVMHHPRDPSALPARRNPYLPGPPETKASPAASSAAMPKDASDQVLSVFAPDDKRAGAPVR